MVVLSVAICTKSGKALLSRQFVEMTRIRIEGLLAAFPKLVGSDSKQHTFIETESVRYVYQPIESLYLLIITNRASNIVEDLETLRLLSKVVPDIAGTTNNLNEDKITEKVFELIFAFDEVITAGGYKEPINLQQIRTNMEMESHEEKLHNMIKISKMETAKDAATNAAKAIRAAQNQGKGPTGMGNAPLESLLGSPKNSQSNSMPYPETTLEPVAPRPTERIPPKKGMTLTAKGGPNKSLEDALVQEDKLAPVISKKSSSVEAVVTTAPVVQQPVMLVVSERVVAKISRDGMVESFEIKGSLTLTASNDEAALCSVQMNVGSVDAFTFNTHPKVNKAVFDSSGLIQLKDTTKGFPSARPVGILKWSYASTTDDMIPLKINCWPEEESRGQMNVSIEYSMDLKDMELLGVKIKIPLGTSESPNILNMDGSHRHSASAQEMVWELDLIDKSNSTGSLEFTISQKNADAFFPISVQFESQKMFCHIDVASVTTADGNAPIQYGLQKSMGADEYTIE